MSLNIYTIKHPLVSNWTSSLIHSPNEQNKQKQETLKKISLCLIYEAMRKSIYIQELYIKNLDYINHINIISNNNINIVCCNFELHISLKHSLDKLIPNISIYPIIMTSDQKIININDKKTSKRKDNIIILEPYLEAKKIIQIINHIDSDYKLSNNIQICVIKVSTNEIQKLSEIYSHFSVYTTKIINDN
uniref:Uracil phosphoribosyltransferase n=1 Tax=Galaxaura rugosa TaxID=268570 RepID=A0A1G4NT72_9FLOR|nr:Uracil phosphoribosyltransferase [Galaxaura rugosa]SCW21858.1 Uracil phosphoribosyltransferase [Galaxaura rugosa]